MKRVILLEDDAVLSKEVSTYLASRDFECDREEDGENFLKRIEEENYGVYLLDVNLPGLSGMEVCERIRSKNKNTPIIMLTAYGDIRDKQQAYNLGADDYLVKPFHLDELFLRINSLLKRGAVLQEDEIIRIADLEIQVGEKKVFRASKEIELTPKEYNLLLFLARNKNKVISKQMLAENVWNIYFETNYNTIEVYMNFLRKKVDRDFDKKLLFTKTGYGYYLSEE
ncbi:MAG: response regulator transcription factor [Bacteroidetes bacterium]|nr:response regulator transcription factor [Bacteroidota bacterium]